MLLSCLAPAARADEPEGGTPVRVEADGPTFLLQADYLLWSLDRDRVPFPLAVASPDGAALGAGNEVPVFGDGLGASGLRSGLRLRAALMSCEGYGIEVGGFLLERDVVDQTSDPAAVFGTGVLARPFTDAVTGVQGLNVLNLGTSAAGSIRVRHETHLWGAEANVVARGSGGLIDGYFGGYRYLALRERLRITDRTTTQLGGLGFFNGQPVNQDDTRVKSDEFETGNDFHGAQVGLRAAVRRGAFDVTARSSVALGVSQQT
ncbi:MAG: BBP7 family outer membrane beta-barrel protein, partial [Gemmataceae bacterium]